MYSNYHTCTFASSLISLMFNGLTLTTTCIRLAVSSAQLFLLLARLSAVGAREDILDSDPALLEERMEGSLEYPLLPLPPS